MAQAIAKCNLWTAIYLLRWRRHRTDVLRTGPSKLTAEPRLSRCVPDEISSESGQNRRDQRYEIGQVIRRSLDDQHGYPEPSGVLLILDSPLHRLTGHRTPPQQQPGVAHRYFSQSALVGPLGSYVREERAATYAVSIHRAGSSCDLSEDQSVGLFQHLKSVLTAHGRGTIQELLIEEPPFR